MLRAFNQHHIRFTQSLDGVWDFVTAEDAKLNKNGLPKSYNRKAVVPVAWKANRASCQAAPRFEFQRDSVSAKTGGPRFPDQQAWLPQGVLALCEEIRMDCRHRRRVDDDGEDDVSMLK